MEQTAREPARGGGVTVGLRPAADPEVIELDATATIDDLAGEWRELAAAVEGSSYFQTPDWILGWWETLGGRPSTRLAAWRTPDGRLDALVALSRDRERLHHVAPISIPVYANTGSGMGAADHCGWLVGARHAEAVGAWISETIDSSPLLVRSADRDWPGAEVLPAGARVVDTIACPRLTLGGGDEGPSPSFVRQLRRFTGRLAREGVRIEIVPATAVDDALLDALFALHADRRRRRGGSTFGLEQLAFHRRLLARAGTGRGPEAVIARHEGGDVVGVLYGFRWRDTFAAYQSGWDPRHARHGLGNVLLLHALDHAVAQGVRTFDFLRGTEPYKYRFGARDRRDSTWLVSRGAAGAVLDARYRLRNGIKQP
jgi:CelD/BcsL family acetyltransferase involved in cellulose biosynthesis